MKRFVNASISTRQADAISEFSDVSRFLVSGVARGWNNIEYSWFADFLFKNEGNLSINPHIGYVSFVSDRDIMHQEYGNIAKIYNEYPFFSYLERSILSDNSYELTTKQYATIGQKYLEYDVLEYINASELLRYASIDPVVDYDIQHEFYRAPIFLASGYKLDMDDDGYVNFSQYLWAPRSHDESEVGEYFSLIKAIQSGGGDLGNDNEIIYNDHAGSPVKLIDYKLNVDNSVYAYFEAELRELVMYYKDSTHYSGETFYPYYGLVNIYNKEFKTEGVNYPDYLFFPELIRDGRLEPAKIILDWGTGESQKGVATFNPGNHLKESTDQSRIVYSACRRMITYDDVNEHFFVQRKDDSDNIIYSGIDLDTERNRRYSAVVMTEPYMVTEPLGNGEMVEYQFVDRTGAPVNFNAMADNFMLDPNLFLKVKAPLHMFSEIDSAINSREYNADIINTLIIKSPESKLAFFNAAGDYYDKLGGTVSIFFRRQDDCLDDLIGGIVGTGTHKEFFITAFGSDASKYSDSKMKICGLGYISKTIADSRGVVTGVESELRAYCSNYSAVNAPMQGTTSPPMANEPVELITSSAQVDSYMSGERLCPMIKLAGMNGYIKILEKNPHFRNATKTSDGKYEMVYNVEFPFCPGSYYSRLELDCSYGKYLSGFIYKKRSYISAGSREVDANSHYDLGNDRHVPLGDDSFTSHSVLLQHSEYGSVITDPYVVGGGLWQYNAVPKNRVSYPADLVWRNETEWKRFALIKSKIPSYARYGTYDIGFDEDRREGGVDDIEFNVGAMFNAEIVASGIPTDTGKWVVSEFKVDEYFMQYSSNMSGLNKIYLNRAYAVPNPRDDLMSIFRFVIANTYASLTHGLHIRKIDILHGSRLIDRTTFDDGETNGWLVISGDDTGIVDSPDSEGKTFYATSRLVFQKILPRSLSLSEDEIKIQITYWLQSDGWEYSYALQIFPYNGQGNVGMYTGNAGEISNFDYTIGLIDVETTVPGAATLPYFSRDMKLFCLADNRQWKFAEDKFSSYINRENPSYVCEMNVSALLDDYSEYQMYHGAIPDIKRWLYGYVSGFAHVLLDKDVEAIPDSEVFTEKVSTMGANHDLVTSNSGSDITVEIWDSKASLGNGQLGNWRPFNSIESDIHKIPGSIIVDNIYISGSTVSSADDIELVLSPGGDYDNIYSAYIGCYQGDSDFSFPAYIEYGAGVFGNLHGKSNIILYDKVNKKSYHVVYVKYSNDPIGASREIFKIFFSHPDGNMTTLDPDNIPEDGSGVAYELRYASRMMSKDPRAAFATRYAVDEIDAGFLTKFIDFRGPGDPYSDFDRFVVDNKIHFRVRIAKNKNYLQSYFGKDTSLMSYVGQDIETAGPSDDNINFPWSNPEGSLFDAGFDWGKIKVKELVRKFGLNYFKCASK